MVAVYLDTNALIHCVEEETEKLLDLFSGRRELVTSELTLGEVLVAPLQRGAKRLLEIYETLLADPLLIQTVPVDRPVLRRSAQLRATYGGKLPDAIHVATAVLCGCTVILSSDRRLRLPDTLRRVAAEDIDRLDDLP